MLHQFNYATPLSHFLSLHQQQQQSVQQSQHCSNDSSNNSVLSPAGSLCDDPNSSLLDPRYNGKDLSAASASKSSFTIAAILGLSNEMAKETAAEVMPTDLSAVMNLSIHHQEDGGGGGGGGDGGGPGHVTDFSRLSHPRHPGLGSSSQCVSSSANALHHHHHGGHQQQLFSTSPSVAATNRSVNACTQRTTDRGGGGVGGLKHLSSAVLHGGCKKTAKSKRVRTIFTPEQLERLEAEFERQQYMVGPERLYLAHTLQLTEAQVKVWFQNRRIKWRKHHLELTHQRLAAIKQQQQHMHQQLLSEEPADTFDSSSGAEQDQDLCT